MLTKFLTVTENKELYEAMTFILMRQSSEHSITVRAPTTEIVCQIDDQIDYGSKLYRSTCQYFKYVMKFCVDYI